jgi:hypothetical protein
MVSLLETDLSTTDSVPVGSDETEESSDKMHPQLEPVDEVKTAGPSKVNRQTTVVEVGLDGRARLVDAPVVKGARPTPKVVPRRQPQ